MNSPRVRVSPGAAFLAAALLFFLREREMAALIPALLVHELGHLAAILGLGMRLRGFRAELGGFSLDYAGETGPAGHVLVALAGPAAGLVYALWASRLGLRTGQDWLCLSAGLSLLLSLFNLLPAPPLDGGRILETLAVRLLGSRRGERLCRAVGLTAGALLAAAGLGSMRRGGGAALLMAGAVLLLSACPKGEGLVKPEKIR